ncbi:lysophospholipid acyltransferase family protein [Nocardia sp. NRRL WC-3656]|uniref:lysophospholipid acyltransferase family protein n=1 Tax=Nocardia sp. NRRL WC-3656 TaxID=1463824 RepID=UPI0035105C00
MRERFTAIVKHTMRWYPVIGPVMRYIGIVFIDRARPDQAIRAMQPALDKLRSGIAVAIAPRGPGHADPAALGPFKKGAFHPPSRPVSRSSDCHPQLR